MAKKRGKASDAQRIKSNYSYFFSSGSSCAIPEQSSVSAESEFKKEDLYIADEMLGLPKIELRDINQDLYDLYDGNSMSSAPKNEVNLFDESSESKPFGK